MTYWIIVRQDENIYLAADTTASVPRVDILSQSIYRNKEVVAYTDTIKLLNTSYLTKENEQIAIGICICGKLDFKLENNETISFEEAIKKFLNYIEDYKKHYSSAHDFIGNMLSQIKNAYLKKNQISADQDLFGDTSIGVAISFRGGKFSIAYYDSQRFNTDSQRISKNKNCSDQKCSFVEYYANEIGYLEMNLPSKRFPDVLREYIGNTANVIMGEHYDEMALHEKTKDQFLYNTVYPFFTILTIDSDLFTNNPKQFVGFLINTYRNRDNKTNVSNKFDFLHLVNGKIREYDPAPRNIQWETPINFAQNIYDIHQFDVDHDPSRPHNTELQKFLKNSRWPNSYVQPYLPYEPNQEFMQFGNFENIVIEPIHKNTRKLDIRRSYNFNPAGFFRNTTTQPVIKSYDESETQRINAAEQPYHLENHTH